MGSTLTINHNKKTVTSVVLAGIIIVIGFFVFLPILVHAQIAAPTEVAAATGLPAGDIRLLVANIIRGLLGLLGVIFVVLILYGGWLYMTSQGETDKITKAKEVIRNAIIGLIIILLSYAIASFVFSLLGWRGGGGGGGGAGGGAGPYGGVGGALGGGIIESHYPLRNAKGVPRNTVIVVTFKEPMDESTIARDDNGNGIFGDCVGTACDSISGNIIIEQTVDGGDPVSITNVQALAASDRKTFVFKPVDPLGNEQTPTWHKVTLAEGIEKANGEAAFGGYGNYDWDFEASTILDLVPPHITSVIPQATADATATVPKNSVVQVTFSEPMNPLTLIGQASVTGSPANNQTIGTSYGAGSYSLIELTAEVGGTAYKIGGRFVAGNGYTVVEFTTLDPCGTNTCGEQIFCLPANPTASQLITALVKSATRTANNTAIFPYDGVVDMADNSMDGNYDGKATAGGTYSITANGIPSVLPRADNSDGDNAAWTFYTEDQLQLTPPRVTQYTPGPGELGVDPRQPIAMTFDTGMMASTLKPDAGYGDGYFACSSSNDTFCPTLDISGLGIPDAVGRCSATFGYCVDSVKRERIVCTPTLMRGKESEPYLCKQREHIGIMPQGTSLGVGYWITSDTFANGTDRVTQAMVMHEALTAQSQYGIKLGSGLRDLYQNCYTPSSGPGCLLAETGPGQFEAGNEWTFTGSQYLCSATGASCTPGDGSCSGTCDRNTDFPSCRPNSSIFTVGSRYTIGYDLQGRNTVVSAQSYKATTDMSARAFYNISDGSTSLADFGEPFASMFADARTAFFLFEDKIGNAHLVIVNGTRGGADGGKFSLSIAGMPATIGVIVKDDDSDAYSTALDPLTIDWDWTAGESDGAVIDLGQSRTWTLTVTPSKIKDNGNAVCRDNPQTSCASTADCTASSACDQEQYLRFYYPGGSAALDLFSPFTISAR